MEYRVTEQIATVVEVSYNVEAVNEEHAQTLFEENRDDFDPIDVEVIRKNAEIVSVEELG